jgi:hypothetical protein
LNRRGRRRGVTVETASETLMYPPWKLECKLQQA